MPVPPLCASVAARVTDLFDYCCGRTTEVGIQIKITHSVEIIGMAYEALCEVPIRCDTDIGTIVRYAACRCALFRWKRRYVVVVKSTQAYVRVKSHATHCCAQ